MESELLGRYAVVGELALDGTMRPAKGALSVGMADLPKEAASFDLPIALGILVGGIDSAS